MEKWVDVRSKKARGVDAACLAVMHSSFAQIKLHSL